MTILFIVSILLMSLLQTLLSCRHLTLLAYNAYFVANILIINNFKNLSPHQGLIHVKRTICSSEKHQNFCLFFVC